MVKGKILLIKKYELPPLKSNNLQESLYMRKLSFSIENKRTVTDFGNNSENYILNILNTCFEFKFRF